MNTRRLFEDQITTGDIYRISSASRLDNVNEGDIVEVIGIGHSRCVIKCKRCNDGVEELVYTAQISPVMITDSTVKLWFEEA